MANAMQHQDFLLLLLLFLSFHHSYQLQLSQSQSLFTIQKLLGFPPELTSFSNSTDLCNIEPTPSLTLVCYENNLTQLHITGNNGSLPSFPLQLSTQYFFETVSSLSTLKVLSLVSLGLWGKLPPSVGELTSLEIFNVSSNYFIGGIPEQLSSLKNLQTLILDHNKFSGGVPDWLGSLTSLAVLSLKNNSLDGFLPDSLKGLENLRILSLSNNYLSGDVPDLSNLTNLQVLDVENNYFGPHFPGLHNRLVTLVLRNNSFQFGIPSELGSYYHLQKLDISLNKFTGPFIPSLFRLPSLNYLDVSQNKFTGMLFKNMTCKPDLAYINLSSNHLSGDLPTCLTLNSKKRVIQYAYNCLSNREQDQHPPNFCHNEALAVRIEPRDKEKHKGQYGKAVLASSTMVGVVSAIAIVGLVVFVVKRGNNKDSVEKPQTRVIVENVPIVNTVKLLSDARYISRTMKLGASLPTYRTFALEELKEATSNFDASNLLGERLNGQIYTGKLLDGTLVAIRSVTVKKKQNHQSFTHHIELISKLRHMHLLSSLGHCFDYCLQDDFISRIFFVFQFVPSGTLRDHISGSQGQKLTWAQRIAASIGIVKGIQFLHTGIVPGVFPNNLKITDVLIDHDLLHVKLSSYDLPLLTEIRGTFGAMLSSGSKHNFLARDKHDEKKDVYDFGVILLEILVGRTIISTSDAIISKDILQASVVDGSDTARRNAVDPAVKQECSNESLRIMMDICSLCLSDDPLRRPSIEDVLWNLLFAAQVQESGKRDSHMITESIVSSP